MQYEYLYCTSTRYVYGVMYLYKRNDKHHIPSPIACLPKDPWSQCNLASPRHSNTDQKLHFQVRVRREILLGGNRTRCRRRLLVCSRSSPRHCRKIGAMPLLRACYLPHHTCCTVWPHWVPVNLGRQLTSPAKRVPAWAAQCRPRLQVPTACSQRGRGTASHCTLAVNA